MCDLSPLRPWEMADERFDMAWWMELVQAKSDYQDGRERFETRRAATEQAKANATARKRGR